MVEKLKVGIVGLRRGRVHLTSYLAVEEAEVIGCADRIKGRREKALAGIAPEKVPMVAEFEELLEMRPDAVVIASNARWQARHAIQAMEAGCHVVSEVPGAFTQEEIVQLVAMVERTGKQYMLAENSCFHDFLRYWRKWIVEDWLGPISIAEGEYLHYLPFTMTDADGNSYMPTQLRDQGITGVEPVWRADQPPIQYLTHELGPLLNVLDDRVVSVTCRSAPWRHQEAPLRPDGQIALFQTAKGILVEITVALNTRVPRSTHNYRLFGTLGSAEFYSDEGFCRRLDRNRDQQEGWERVEIGRGPWGEDKASTYGGANLKTAYHFTKAILEDRTPPIDVYRMCDFALPGIIAARSAELGGQPITVPDIRRQPFEGTNFWEHVPLPEKEPEGRKWSPI